MLKNGATAPFFYGCYSQQVRFSSRRYPALITTFPRRAIHTAKCMNLSRKRLAFVWPDANLRALLLKFTLMDLTHV